MVVVVAAAIAVVIVQVPLVNPGKGWNKYLALQQDFIFFLNFYLLPLVSVGYSSAMALNDVVA
jgi:hypothetical protein